MFFFLCEPSSWTRSPAIDERTFNVEATIPCTSPVPLHLGIPGVEHGRLGRIISRGRIPRTFLASGRRACTPLLISTGPTTATVQLELAHVPYTAGIAEALLMET